MKFVLGLLAVMFLFSIPAKATPTAGQLQTICQATTKTGTLTTEDTLSVGMCVGYIGGWIDGVNGVFVKVEGKFVMVVFAKDVTVPQVIRVFSKFITEHPEFENKGADEVLPSVLLASKLMGVRPIAPDSKEQ